MTAGRWRAAAERSSSPMAAQRATAATPPWMHEQRRWRARRLRGYRQLLREQKRRRARRRRGYLDCHLDDGGSVPTLLPLPWVFPTDQQPLARHDLLHNTLVHEPQRWELQGTTAVAARAAGARGDEICRGRRRDDAICRGRRRELQRARRPGLEVGAVRRLAQQQAGNRVRRWGKAASTCGAVVASVREKEIRMEEKVWVPQAHVSRTGRRNKALFPRGNLSVFLCKTAIPVLLCMLSPAAAVVAAVRAAAGSRPAVRCAHASLLKEGLALHPPAPSLLVSAYAKCRLLPDARQLFDESPQRDLHLYSSLLAAISNSDSPALVLPLLRRMLSVDALQPDHFVLASIASASARLRSLSLGKQVHAHFVASPYSGDNVVKSSLIDMYCKCGVPEEARKVFDSMTAKNNVVWTALVSGYASNGYTDEALQLFRSMPGRGGLFTWTALISGFVKAGESVRAVELFVDMRRDGVTIDDAFLLSAITGGAADLAALVLGRQLHGLSMRLGFLSSMMVGNALVDMYSKCSDIHSAREVFEEITVCDIISWTTMIVGEAQHGRAEDAFALYDRMVLAGVKPNEVTFVGLIYACSHAGLVQKGRQLFDSVKQEYGINPGLQLYTCYIDLLSRSGYLSEAEELITRMPYEPDEAVWGSLLSACKKHNNAEMSLRVADNLLELRPKYPSTYVLLSNVYAVNGKWDSVDTVRKLMANTKILKEPGYSRIDVGRESRLFHAGEVPLDVREEIIAFLDELVVEMRQRGYVPDTSSVMHDLEEHEKEHHLFLHSERLAVAFGILKSPPGSVIRVVKNLRVCGDCHTVMKLMSEIFQRKISVRDASRFHHFEDGKCSCSDFW